MSVHTTTLARALPDERTQVSETMRLERAFRAEQGWTDEDMSIDQGRLLYLCAAVPLAMILLDLRTAQQSPPLVAAMFAMSALTALAVYLMNRDQSRAARRSELDDLTGLFNRSRFHVDLVREVSRSSREHETLLLSYIEIQRLQQGRTERADRVHDDVIRTVCRVLYQTARAKLDSCYRVGANELVVLSRVPLRSDTRRMRRRSQAIVEQLNEALVEGKACLSLSTVELDTRDTVESFLHRADAQLETFKKARCEEIGAPLNARNSPRSQRRTSLRAKAN